MKELPERKKKRGGSFFPEGWFHLTKWIGCYPIYISPLSLELKNMLKVCQLRNDNRYLKCTFIFTESLRCYVHVWRACFVQWQEQNVVIIATWPFQLDGSQALSVPRQVLKCSPYHCGKGVSGMYCRRWMKTVKEKLRRVKRPSP